MDPPRVRLTTLVREELRALPRQTFAMSAIAIVLAVFVPIAAFGYGGEGGLDDMLIFVWIIAELVVAIVVAGRVAAARRSRFVDSLYTTPLEQRTWFFAQLIVGAVLAGLVLAIQVPFLLVHIAYLGIPAALPSFLLAALLMGAFAVALGLFCGVLVGDSGPGAAAGLAGGLAFMSFVLFIVQGIVVSGPPTTMQPVLVRLTSISPLALAMAGTGTTPFGVVPAHAWRPLVGLVALILGLGAAAWFAYTRAQGPLGWEARGSGRRAIVVALAALAVATPVASAEVSFVEDQVDDSWIFSRGEHTQIAFVARGAPIVEDSFTFESIVSSPDLPLGEPVELDALVLVMVPQGTNVRGVRVEVVGIENVRVVEGGTLNVPDGSPAGRAPPGEGWDSVADTPPRPVYRVPVTLEATALEALGDSPSLVEVRTQFMADGKALTSVGKIALDGKVPGAVAQLMLAGAPLPLGAVASLVARKLRTR